MMYSSRLSVVFCSSQKTCVCVHACVFSLKKKIASSAGDLLQLFSQKLAGDVFSWGSKAIKPQKAGVSG